MMNLLWRLAACGSLLCVLVHPGLAVPLQAEDAERKEADILPASTIIYVEGQSSETVLNLPLVKSITSTELFRQIWRSPDVMKARGGITLAEVALGERVTDALARATSGGWVVAVDGQSDGAILLAATKDKQTCAELYAKLESIASQDAKNNNRQFEQVTYHDVTAYKIGDAIVAALDKWLMVTNKSSLAKTVVDNFVTPSKGTLKGQAQFNEVRRSHAHSGDNADRPLAWAYINIEQVRTKIGNKGIFKRPDDNFVAELVFGGVLSVVRNTSYATGSLIADGHQVTLHLSAPTPRAAKTRDYQFFFGEDLNGIAPPALPLAEPHATLTAHRDVSKLWRHAGDLFGQSVNDQLAQADATLTTLFSGRDFGEEILGAIEPGVQIVVVPQTDAFDPAAEPKLKLPAFALSATLKDPLAMRPQLKRIFMSLIGFINIAGAQNQQPQLDLDISGNFDETYTVTSQFVVEHDRPKEWVVPIQYNFSPTLKMWKNRVVLSSTRGLAEKIADQWQQPPASTGPAKADSSNTHLHVDGQLVSQALAVNREQLISQNMLEKGHTQDEAAGEIDLLLKIIDLAKALDVRLDVHQQTELYVELSLK